MLLDRSGRHAPAEPPHVGRALPVTRGVRGQATVELVALLPLLVFVAALLWQLALAGHATWAAGGAARAAARAQALGADPVTAARGALPADLRRGLKVSERDGSVRVEVRIPPVTPVLDLGRTAADAQFPAQAA